MISANSPLATAVSALATAKSNLAPIPPRGYRNLGFRLSSQRFGPSEMDLVRKVTRGCFGDRAGKGWMVEVESMGGEDVFDAVVAAEAKVFPEHLVIMVNGIVGSAADWKYAAEQFVKKLPDKVIVHREIRGRTLDLGHGGRRHQGQGTNMVEMKYMIEDLSLVVRMLK